MPQALLAAPLVLALVLVGAGVLKLGDDDAATAVEWDALRVPVLLNRRRVRRAHPWGEIALAVALLVLPGAAGVLTGLAAVGLCLVYTVLIAYALRSPGSVCSCFGAAHQAPLTPWTLARNVLLSVLAVLSVVSAAALGAPLEAAVQDATVLSWLLAVALAMATVQLVSSPPSAPAAAREPGGGSAPVPAGGAAEPREVPVSPSGADSGVTGGAAQEGDYLRTLTPYATFTAADGRTVDLVGETRRRAHLLVFLSPGCGPCAAVASRVPEWSQAMPQLAVRIVTTASVERVRDRTPAWAPLTWHDADGVGARMLRCLSTPSAVLLGTDGMLAGGPVTGAEQVIELAEEVLAQLDQG